jgi:mono/diheme cytochrome c family protein
VLLAAVNAGLAAAATPIRGNTTNGRAIFMSHTYVPLYSCGGCHILKAGNGSGTIGGNLDKLKPSYATVIAFVTNGSPRTARVPTGMPQYGGDLGVLSKKQIQDVAAFVYKATHR